MATKSITKSVIIDSEKGCEKLLDAIERSQKHPVNVKPGKSYRELKNDEVLKFFGDRRGRV